YGRAEQTINEKAFLIEVRSLNGKQYDIRLALPALLKPYEIDVRNILNEGLVRGSVECTISVKQNGGAKPVTINTDLLKAYYTQVIELAGELNIEADNNILGTLLKLPEVVAPSTDVLGEAEWNEFKELLQSAIAQLNAHRKIEGASMETDLLERIASIENQQDIVATLEPRRREKIKDGLKKVLEENVGKENYDPNRLEQELIYYIEKIDISEEQVRLKNHCDYFRAILKENEVVKGKKLSFILQEIGREINTTGSKAYDAEVQKAVVLMKDELEKAKEQILNVL
ncbi:MAG TPA: YicC/YloC family endoribonuclease, partial [Chitinophagaceae bacterium]|nr:YicC/YloC family endoribonuclease [Chitinophagaceae bacterium]